MCGKMFIKMHVSKENYIGPFKTHPTENSQWEEKGPRLPRWLSGKESACQSRRHRFDPGSGKSPGGGNGNPLQYSCLGNPMDRGPWWATVHGVSKSRTRLSDFTFTLNSFPMSRLPLCLLKRHIKSLVNIHSINIYGTTSL